MIKHKHLLIVLAIVFVVFMALVGVAAHATTPATHSYPTLPTAAPLRQDPQAVSVMQRLGLDYSKLVLIYGNDDIMNAHSDTFASFTTPNIVHIRPGTDDKRMNSALSHEYIHYRQYQDEATAQSFYPYLESLQQSDKWLNGRMAYYHQNNICTSTDGSCVDKEAEAIACTEMPDYALHADFVAWCNSILPKRSLLFQ